MTEDVFVIDCHSDIFVWVGQEVDAKVKSQAMDIGEVKPKLSSIN
jgi:gelsolin